jgi:hypothetical protein
VGDQPGKIIAEFRGLTLSSSQPARTCERHASVAAAVLALISGTAGAVIQASMTRDVEASKSSALVAIEEIKAKANIDLERQKQEAAEHLDRLKFETSLIAKATESPTGKNRFVT